MIIIDYTLPPTPAKRFEAKADSIIIGRSAPGHTVDLDLTPDHTVSRRHALLTYEEGIYSLEDLGSKYGTFVNDRQIIRKVQLKPGDRVTVGQTILDIFFLDAGILTSSVSATESTPNLLLDIEPDLASLETARRRLMVLYELSETLGTTQSVDSLLRAVVEHLCKVLPDAHRGAVLLWEQQELALKAYVPEQFKPAVSFNLASLAIESREAFIWRRGKWGKTGMLSDSVIRHGTQSAIYAPLIWQGEVLGVVFVDNFMAKSAFNDDDLRLLMAMANQAAMFVKNYALQRELRHEEVVRSNLLRQFSPQVAERLERLLKDTSPLRIGGKRADPATILTSDVRGFTSLSAEMEPNDVVAMLNELFSACIPIIFKHNGTVDKYVGDAILAVFGSPDPDERQWENAVRAAMEMQQAMARVSEERARRGQPVCQVGIGIHTGAVLHGFIGAEEHMEFTVIGDAVNRASRYCDGAGPGEIIISPAVFERVARLVAVAPRTIISKHPDTESDLEAYVVEGFNP
jgi:adenylate cyclase